MKRPSWMNYKPKIKKNGKDSLDLLLEQLAQCSRRQGMSWPMLPQIEKENK